jgi:hypothetical protein
MESTDGEADVAFVWGPKLFAPTCRRMSSCPLYEAPPTVSLSRDPSTITPQLNVLKLWLVFPEGQK